MSDDNVKAGCTWLDDFASEDVGVNDWYLVLGQQAGYRRLAYLVSSSASRAGPAGEGKEKGVEALTRGDTACETYDCCVSDMSR